MERGAGVLPRQRTLPCTGTVLAAVGEAKALRSTVACARRGHERVNALQFTRRAIIEPAHTPTACMLRQEAHWSSCNRPACRADVSRGGAYPQSDAPSWWPASRCRQMVGLRASVCDVPSGTCMAVPETNYRT